ncbi:MAG: type II secretion system protein [Vicinamibacterales bacterium]
MKGQRGYTLVELLVAAAVMVTATSGIFVLLANGLGNSALWNESADLHQRARVAADVLSSELAAAGAGTPEGPLIRFLPPVEPRRRGRAAAMNAVTIRSVPDNAPWSTLTADLPVDGSSARIAIHAGCRVGIAACGFGVGTEVVLFDGAGNWDLAFVQGAGGDTLALADVVGSRSVAYLAGARIAQIVETTLFLDEVERQLRREQPGSGALPVIDHVVGLQLSYFGDPLPVSEPAPPPGVANCLFTSSGGRIAHPVLAADHGRLAAMPVSMLTDGPFCGSGAGAYDVDLFRIRSIRASVRLQTGVEMLRGREPRLFIHPGGATIAERMIPDTVMSVELSPRNLLR